MSSAVARVENECRYCATVSRRVAKKVGNGPSPSVAQRRFARPTPSLDKRHARPSIGFIEGPVPTFSSSASTSGAVARQALGRSLQGCRQHAVTNALLKRLDEILGAAQELTEVQGVGVLQRNRIGRELASMRMGVHQLVRLKEGDEDGMPVGGLY